MVDCVVGRLCSILAPTTLRVFAAYAIIHQNQIKSNLFCLDLEEKLAPSRSKRSMTCGVRARFTNAQRKEVVNAHNALRRVEDAAGMVKMVTRTLCRECKM